MEYKLRKANIIADALSRKEELASLARVTCDLADQIKKGLSQDPIKKLDRDG